MNHDDRGCAYHVGDGEQCDKPPSIKVKQPAPPPYSHLMMEMWLCAEHYDQWMKEVGDSIAFPIEGETDATN